MHVLRGSNINFCSLILHEIYPSQIEFLEQLILCHFSLRGCPGIDNGPAPGPKVHERYAFFTNDNFFITKINARLLN